ncbi:MAG: acyl--CoA ligase family protein [Firmicutes bacterium]|nr:acyl--CoA ligase family protein [Bacillota bacterium]
MWSHEAWTRLPPHRSLLTPLSFLYRSLHVYPDKVAVVDGRWRTSYAEFAGRVFRLASALLRRGLQPGGRVAVLCRNAQEVLEAHFAVPQAGGVLVPINVRLSAHEVAYILDHSGARFLVADRELADLVAASCKASEAPPQVLWVDLGPRHGAATPDPPADVQGLSYEEFLQEGRPEPFPPPLEDEEEVLSINYTSGTTGRPKGVMVTHRGCYLNALGEVIEVQLTPETRYLWTLPMFHCNGWNFPYAVTAVGATHVCLPRVEAASVYRLVEEEGVTHFCAAPTVLILLTAGKPAPEYRFPRPVTVVTAASPPPPAVLEAVEGMGARVVHVYGLTETYGPHTVCAWRSEWDGLEPAERARRKARQGVGYVHAPELRVVDEQMRDVPADGQTLGEVVMRGNNVMRGYFRDPEATARAFEGGWFHSGDLAVVHPDGYIELRDRKKDIIISGGENISSIEVERVLYRHPAVLEAAVVGVPDDRWGEVPKAYVVLRPGQAATEEELVAFCRQHLAHFKCPKRVEFLAELPKTSTGKIQKFVLREREWAGRDRRIG